VSVLQITFIAAVGVTFLGANLALWKRGGKIGWKDLTFVVQGTGRKIDGPLAQALYRVETEISAVQTILFRRYLSLMEKSGADVNNLASYDDARFMKLLLRYAVSGGNGSNSTQKIMEEEVLKGYYRRHGDELDRYVHEHILPMVTRRIVDGINAEYDTTVLQRDGSYRDRWVPATEYIVDISSPAVQREIAAILVLILQYARGCILDGCA
jgi:hypothetical protein